MRFKLASNKVQKLDCPACGKKKHWQRYIDTETGEILPDEHGKCDNTQKCGYWVTPKDTGYAKELWKQEQGHNGAAWKPPIKPRKPAPAAVVPFDFATFKGTLQPERYAQNQFIHNLLHNLPFPFEPADVTKVVELYRLGTIAKGYRAGAITFPYIDQQGRVQAVQVKTFDQRNHTTGTDFLHSMLAKHHERKGTALPEWLQAYDKQERKVGCLFGEHLLGQYPANPVALVEAPKTAIYGTLYFGIPEQQTDLLWLAVYNKSAFTSDRMQALQGRFVYVFPDLSADGGTFREWEQKARQFQSEVPRSKFACSDLLEQHAPDADRQAGSDLADFLIKQDWKGFRPQGVNEVTQVKLQKKVGGGGGALEQEAAPAPEVENAPAAKEQEPAPALPAIENPHELAAKVAPQCDSWKRQTIYAEIAKAVGCSYHEAPDIFYALIEAEAIEPNLVGYHLAGSSPF